MMPASLLLLAVALVLTPGCVSKPANLEISGAKIGWDVYTGFDIFCSVGKTETMLHYTLWNAGPGDALDIHPTYTVTAGANALSPGATVSTGDGQDIPALPVNARHAYSIRVTLHEGCDNATGQREDYSVALRVEPKTGPTVKATATISCKWGPTALSEEHICNHA